MITSILLTAVVSFGLGGLLSSEDAKRSVEKAREERLRTPDIWKPEDHTALLSKCAIMCGEGKFSEYSSTYGSCKCQ